jgi:hypothetical protein
VLFGRAFADEAEIAIGEENPLGLRGARADDPAPGIRDDDSPKMKNGSRPTRLHNAPNSRFEARRLDLSLENPSPIR